MNVVNNVVASAISSHCVQWSVEYSAWFLVVQFEDLKDEEGSGRKIISLSCLSINWWDITAFNRILNTFDFKQQQNVEFYSLVTFGDAVKHN